MALVTDANLSLRDLCRTHQPPHWDVTIFYQLPNSSNLFSFVLWWIGLIVWKLY